MSNPHTETIFGALAATALLAGCAWWYGSILYQVAVLRETFTAEQERVAVEQERHRAHAVLRRSLATVFAARTELDSYTLSENAVARFLAQIEAAGAARGVGITTTSIKDESDEGDAPLRVTFQAAGSREQVDDALALLETLPYQSSVVDVTMARGSGSVGWVGTFAVLVPVHP